MLGGTSRGGGSSMASTFDPSVSRRRFMQFLAGSPLLAAGGAPAFAQPFLPKPELPDPLPWAPLDARELIKDPKDAINVFDFEPVMRQNVRPAHFGYMAPGSTTRGRRAATPQTSP